MLTRILDIFVSNRILLQTYNVSGQSKNCSISLLVPFETLSVKIYFNILWGYFHSTLMYIYIFEFFFCNRMRCRLGCI